MLESPVPQPPSAEECAVGVLAAMGDPAVDPLAGLLRHESLHVRVEAARALGLIGAGARRAVPALIASLNDRGGTGAARALAEIGDPAAIPAILEHIEEIEPTSIARIVGAPLVPGLVRIVADPRSPTKAMQQAADGLAAVDAKPAGAVTPLVQALGRPHSRDKMFDPEYDATATPLRCLVEAIESFEEDAAPALPRLRILAHDPHEHVRGLARAAIIVIAGQDGPDALRFQVEDLTSVDFLDGHHGTDAAAKAAAALAVPLRDGHAPGPLQISVPSPFGLDRLNVPMQAAWTIGRLDTPAAVAPLTEALGSLDPAVVVVAAEALGRRGATAMAAVPDLEKIARTHWQPHVSSAAAEALRAIDGRTIVPPPAPPAIPWNRDDTLWDVSTAKGVVRIDNKPDPNTRRYREPLRECERLQPPCHERGTTFRVGQDWLAVISKGEWGSCIVTFGRTSERTLWEGGHNLVPFGDGYLVLGEEGVIAKIVTPAPSQEFLPGRLVTALPGNLIAYEDPPGALLVVVAENPWTPPPPLHRHYTSKERDSWGRRIPGEPQEVSAYAIDASGTVTRLAVKSVAEGRIPRKDVIDPIEEGIP